MTCVRSAFGEGHSACRWPSPKQLKQHSSCSRALMTAIAISLSSESMNAASSSTVMPSYEFQTSWDVAAAQASSKDS